MLIALRNTVKHVICLPDHKLCLILTRYVNMKPSSTMILMAERSSDGNHKGIEPNNRENIQNYL